MLKTLTGPTLSPLTHRTIPEQGRPTTSAQAASSFWANCCPSPFAGSLPVLSPLTSIPGPSADVFQDLTRFCAVTPCSPYVFLSGVLDVCLFAVADMSFSSHICSRLDALSWAI
ncbi:hypothetical protein BD311DRAFT_817961 [Dichomitus squalens]|uniref:Uncharacterized protein n=1 Tax=Dichomitus squalens TaxID=114155 RepID=A0A4Q9MCM1_9APHY|nr:hypothetical protein BD311DRAFT_817961 [Dichomitus squalens]